VTSVEGARRSIVVLGAVWLLCTGFSGTPEILPDRVIFVGGKVVPYEASKVLQPDPSAIRADDVVSFTERPIVLRILRRVVFVREERLYEGGSMQLSVYDFGGSLLGSSERVSVEVDGLFFLESQKRIFLGQSSSHSRVEASSLLDENGRLVRRVTQPRSVGSFGHSGDERLIWIVSNIWVRPPGKEIAEQIGEVRVIDTDGNLVARREFNRAQTVNIRYKGKVYKISVEVPSLP
jgi:hypothetical protein